MAFLDSPDVITKGGETKRQYFQRQHAKFVAVLERDGPYQMPNCYTGSIVTPHLGVNVDISFWNNTVEVTETYEPGVNCDQRYKVAINGIEQSQEILHHSVQIPFPELPHNNQRRKAGGTVEGFRRTAMCEIQSDALIEIFERETGILCDKRVALFSFDHDHPTISLRL